MFGFVNINYKTCLIGGVFHFVVHLDISGIVLYVP